MNNDTVINLEIAISHLEKTVAELSDVINNQWKEIDGLKRQLSKTNNKIEELESSLAGEDQANVKPPHW